MPDLVEMLREEYGRFEGDIRGFAGQMRDQRKVLGPRQRKRLREHLLSMQLEESGPIIDTIYAAAKHQLGEKTPCAACRFLGEGEKK